MSTPRLPIRLIILIGILTATAVAFAIPRGDPAPSGITDTQVKKLPLGELNTLLRDISYKEARKRHTGGDVINVSFDHAYLMTQKQWERVAERVVDGITNADGQEFLDAASFAQQIEQYLHRNEQLIIPLRFQKIIDAAITRLHDPDINTARQAAAIAGYFPSAVPVKVDMKHLLKLVDSAPTPEHKEYLMRCVSSLRFSQAQTPSVDTKIVDAARAILEDPASTRPQRMEALNSIKNATGATRDAAKLAAEQYLNEPHDDQRMTLFVLTQLVSIYDNPNEESRQIATEIAMPIFIDAARSDDWSLMMSAAGAARHLYDKALPLVPALIEMIDYPEINTSGMAISALGNIGPSAKDALPKLRAISGTRGNLNESIRDSLYLIAKDGDKPDWYDNHIKQLKEAGIDAD
jgi:hypothetical protein